MLKRLLFCIGLTLLSLSVVSAQSASEGWPIVERCAPVTTPPSDWTYPGVILATGWAGVHGIRAGLDTPYVLAFVNGRYWDGVLSPDGKWYVLAQGKYNDGPLLADSIDIYQLEIYSTLDRNEVYVLPWQNYIGGISDARTTNNVYWLNNEHLIYRNNEVGDVSLNPFTGTIESLENRLILPREGYIFHPSPDWTRAVFNTYRLSPDWQLTDLATGNVLLKLITDPNAIGDWAHDSSKFIFEVDVAEPQTMGSLVVFDLDGKQVDTVFVSEETHSRKFAYGSHEWSPDDRYFAFVPLFYRDTFDYDSYLYIADMLDKQIINSCLTVTAGTTGGIAWSPDGTMLAYSVNSPSNDPVQVFDLSHWQTYTVAYHQGDIIGWREDG